MDFLLRNFILNLISPLFIGGFPLAVSGQSWLWAQQIEDPDKDEILGVSSDYRMFLTKIDDEGDVLAAIDGGNRVNNSGFYNVAADPFGNIYAVGWFGIATGQQCVFGNDPLTSKGESDGYLVKYGVPGAAHQYYLPVQSGNYTVSVSNSMCIDTAACQYILVVSVDQLQPKKEALSIYPVPANTHIVFKGLPETGRFPAEVYDLSGRLLIRASVSATDPVLHISALPAGNHIIRLWTDGEEPKGFVFTRAKDY